MKQWIIPVSWEMCGKITVEADTLLKAMEIARHDDGIHLPEESCYVDGSWDLTDDVYTVRDCYNNGQKDEEQKGE